MIPGKRPIVMCHGLIGWGSDQLGGYPYFFAASRAGHDEGRQLFFPSLGPVSSLHDRACELFYQLKGGVVDYGEEHSAMYGHNRYGKTYKPLCPRWSGEMPLDFVGHSMGAPTVSMLQYLLEKRFFRDRAGNTYPTDGSWIRTCVSVSGVLNGSTLCWGRGLSAETGLLESTDSYAGVMGGLLEKMAALEQKRNGMRKMYDLNLDHWNISAEKTSSLYLTKIADSTSFFTSRDWAGYDLTPNAMTAWNTLFTEYPGTYYMSYVNNTTKIHRKRFPESRKNGAGPEIVPYFRTHAQLKQYARYMASGDYTETWKARFEASGADMCDWKMSDGQSPLASQDFPKLGRVAAHQDLSRIPSGEKRPGRGMWYIMERTDGFDHWDVAMFPHMSKFRQLKMLYGRIFSVIDTV